MKSIKFLLAILVMGIFVMSSCTKQNTDGPVYDGGISGSVTYKDGNGTVSPAPYAQVMIAYGTDAATSTFNQTVLADGSGNYAIKGLGTGKYFVTATYTDKNGFKYTTNGGGFGVSINNTKDVVTANIVLQ